MKRTRFDIAEAILAKTGSGATKDQLIEQVDLPQQTIEKHLQILLYMKFLELKDEHYYTAERGRTFLRIRRENRERNAEPVSERKLDFEGMFKELETIRKKYGVPKGIFFLPDRLEIVIERVEMPGYDRHHLACKEDFHYLPDQVRGRAVEDAIQFLENFGFPPEHFTRTGKGYELRIDGDSRMVFLAIWQLLLLDKQRHDSETESTLDEMSRFLKMYSDAFDLYCRWNIEGERKWEAYTASMDQIAQKHPSVSEEMREIIKKFVHTKA